MQQQIGVGRPCLLKRVPEPHRKKCAVCNYSANAEISVQQLGYVLQAGLTARTKSSSSPQHEPSDFSELFLGERWQFFLIIWQLKALKNYLNLLLFTNSTTL